MDAIGLQADQVPNHHHPSYQDTFTIFLLVFIIIVITTIVLICLKITIIIRCKCLKSALTGLLMRRVPFLLTRYFYFLKLYQKSFYL